MWMCASYSVVWLKERWGVINNSAKVTLTWDPSGCCRQKVSGPVRPPGAARGQTCCRATRWSGRTGGCGTGWRSPSQWQSCFSGRAKCLRRSGCLYAARGWSQHQGKMGLRQEGSRDRAESSGPVHKTGLLGLGRGMSKNTQWEEKQNSQPPEKEEEGNKKAKAKSKEGQKG